MLEFNFHPFPSLETNRLLLREITMDDMEDMFTLRKNMDVLRYLDRHPQQTIAEAQELIKKIIDGVEKNETIGWALCLKENPALIGTVSFHNTYRDHHRAEIGYMIHPDYWRQGFVNEAVVRAIDYGFNIMKLHSIEANVNPNNAGSIALLKKHGFVREAYFKENYFFDGKYLDSEIYSLINHS
jgi:ribosomal-protein-alanine N-acetyltransferase